jgi:hypothetical protein
MGCFSSGGSKSTSTSYTPEQKKWLGKGLETYGPALGGGEQAYPGTTVAEFTPAQKAAMSGVTDYLKAFSPDMKMPGFEETGSALKGILSGQAGATPITPQQTSAFFKSAYQEPATRYFSEYTRPLIREEYAGPGFWGSARAQAVTKAGREMGQWLGQRRGELEWQTGETNRAIQEAKAGRQLSAIPMGMEYAGQPTREAQARLAGRQGVFGFASVGQQQRQREIDAAIDKWRSGKRLTDQESLNILLSLIGQPMQTTSGRDWGAGMFGGPGGFKNLMNTGAGISTLFG